MFVAQSNPYNPVAEYLEGLRDNQDIELMSREEVARLFGVAAGDAVSADLLQRSLAGTAKRGLEPGCKFDQCPILRSEEQGLGKTEALRSLAGPGWYDNLGKADKNLALSGWKVTSKMAGCWVLELGEIDQLTRGHCSSELKDWITTKVDTYAEKKEKLATHTRGDACPGAPPTNLSCSTTTPARGATGSSRWPVGSTGSRSWLTAIESGSRLSPGSTAALRRG